MPRKTDEKDYSISLKEGLEGYDEVSVDVLKKLKRRGFHLPERPVWASGEYFDGRLPANVHELKDGELTELLIMMCQQADWTGVNTAVAKADLTNSAEKVKLARAAVRKSKTGSVQDKDDKTTTDERFQDANREWAAAREYFDILASIHEAASRDVKWLSRTIETRKMELERGRAAVNVNRSKRYRE